MVIDYAPKLDGHDVKSKIGIITGTEIKHSCIDIISLFYVLDFRSEAEKIKKRTRENLLILRERSNFGCRLARGKLSAAETSAHRH